jgi:Protein of unknown function (DUF4199)
MKKTILTFGLISGGIMTVMMWATLPFIDRIASYNAGMVVGYTTIVLSFMLVFFGIRSYRENVGGGEITFGRAFAVGILIALISSALYVISWEVMYFGAPGFADKFTTMCIDHLKNSGASAESIKAQLDQMNRILSNPFLNAAATFTEPFPIGLIVTLISALILKKRKDRSNTSQSATPAVA